VNRGIKSLAFAADAFHAELAQGLEKADSGE
jgi:hypothetical protein